MARQRWLGLSLYTRLFITVVVGLALGVVAAVLLPDWTAWVLMGLLALSMLLPWASSKREHKDHEVPVR